MGKKDGKAICDWTSFGLSLARYQTSLCWHLRKAGLLLDNAPTELHVPRESQVFETPQNYAKTSPYSDFCRWQKKTTEYHSESGTRSYGI